ncbi:saccharopine dehydrogenase [Polymorphobacter glacialis]|uniref:Saccharopine dehydrogenase n=1 Tax=Sandarakinorhabdus glacialis TaxID=1614636 RepID=A0A916ZKS0_9SPHN|nr:saccharopine dehydrogenase NADP-binding domain-containing protein [Polymorphobacter glacialis]GGE02656.1 saccharopine dehydrogenase [Polymorphobacter glacialis]
MTGRVLLYGATGFSGGLIAERMVDLELILAGRNAPALAALGARLQLDWRAFELGDAAAIDAGLAGIGLLVNAAGPFIHTAPAMLAACLRCGVDYLDITGEWPVFERAMGLSDEAAAAGIMLMPGVGVCIVATDCLAAMAVQRNPGTTALRLAASRHNRLVRGSVRTIGGMNAATIRSLRGGAIAYTPAGHDTRHFDFGNGPAPAVAVTWPEIVTGQFSTGIANIETYAEGGTPTRLAVRMAGALAPLGETAAGRSWSRAFADLWPATGNEGPDATDAEALDDNGFVLVAEAIDRWRRVATLRLRIGDGHVVTAITTDAIVRRVLSGDRKPGFWTPSKLYGSDFILELGCAEVLQERS